MQKKQINLVWFRNDLRIDDNPALAESLNSGLPIIALYCFEPRLYKSYFYGIKKTESFRAQFIIEAIKDLKLKLKTLNVGFKISLNSPSQAIQSLLNEFEIKSIYYQKEWTSEEVEVENQLTLSFPKLKFQSYFGQFLYHPEDITYQNYNEIPHVFSHFRVLCQKQVTIRKSIDTPKPQPTNVFINIMNNVPNLSDLGLKTFEKDTRSAFPFKGGETSASERLAYYFWETKKLRYYKKTRNGLLGADYSSKLSPWLAQGCISPRQIYWQVKQFEQQIVKNQDTYWLVFELIWRDYFKYISLKHGNAIFKIGGILNKAYDWHFNKTVFKAWVDGKTKDDFVNANMIELRQTGYMSNRGRQNVASYWSKTLEQDWRVGAAYFEALLIDYDVHSNWGNWMYNSGVGNDPRNRKFNTQLQAKRYDGSREYRKTWLQNSLF